MSLTKQELDGLTAWISSLPGVSSGPHRFGGVEFKVGGLKFMHFHGQTHLDIRLSKADQAKVLDARKAEEHLYAPDAGWVTLRVKSIEDVTKAKEIVCLAYDNAEIFWKQHQVRSAT
jgi:hypothetical protein